MGISARYKDAYVGYSSARYREGYFMVAFLKKMVHKLRILKWFYSAL